MPKLFMDTAPLKTSPEFRRIWLGGMFSTVGYQITAVAIALEIYALTGSPAAVGLTGLVALPSMIIGGLYGGVIADRYDRRKVALTASIGMWVLAMLVALQAGWHWSRYGFSMRSLLASLCYNPSTRQPAGLLFPGWSSAGCYPLLIPS